MGDPENPGSRGEVEQKSGFFTWTSEFADQAVRKGFIRKVYSLLTIQLGISMIFVLLPIINHDVETFVIKYFLVLVITSVVIMISTLLVLLCCDMKRKYPINLILLHTFTIGTSLFLMPVGVVYTKESIAIAAAATFMITVFITIWAFTSKFDATNCGFFALISILCLIALGVLSIFIPALKIFYGITGAVLFSFYIFMDTQRLMSNKKNPLSPEDYVLAVLNLYLDIINLFLKILQIIGGRE